MKRHWIDYHPTWRHSPMTYWVHTGTSASGQGEESLAASPRPIPGKGFAEFHVEIDGFTFQFASLTELDVCIQTLSQKLLPTTIRLSEQRGTGYGPNNHWLSRLPKETKSWRYRQKAVRYLKKAQTHFQEELGIKPETLPSP